MTNMINISLTVSSMYGKISKVEIDLLIMVYNGPYVEVKCYFIIC